MGLPSDIFRLVLTYATEPLYSLPKWIDKKERVGVYLKCLHNPRAYRWIKNNWVSIYNKKYIMKNPHPSIVKLVGNLLLTKQLVHVMCEFSHHHINYSNAPIDWFAHEMENIFKYCPNYEFIMKSAKHNKITKSGSRSEYNGLLANSNSDVINRLIIDDIPYKLLNNNVGQGMLFCNTNPIAMEFLEKYLSDESTRAKIPKDSIKYLLRNSSDCAVNILEKYPELINYNELYNNPNPKVYELITKHKPDYMVDIDQIDRKCPWAYQQVKDFFYKEIANSNRAKIIISDNVFNTDDEYWKIRKILEFLIINTPPECIGFLDENLDLIKSTINIWAVCLNRTKEIIEWVGTHLDYVGYINDDQEMYCYGSNSSCIDIYVLAANNDYLLQDNYLGRFPRKLEQYLMTHKSA